MKIHNNGEIVFEIPQSRYEELIAKEERLHLLEEAVKGHSSYSDLTPIKEIFNLKDEVKTSE